MYRVPNKMSQLQFLKNMSTNFMTIKKKKSQQLRNKSTAAAASGIKISNYMLLPSFDSRISHQRRAENLDVWATRISKNNLATNFSLRLDRYYHPFVTFKPSFPCKIFMFIIIDMKDKMNRTEKNLNHNWGGKASYMFR